MHQIKVSNILDYGGGNGYLTDILRKNGIEAFSYDPFGRKDIDIAKGQYSAVSAIEVLEHEVFPDKLWRIVSDLLLPGGYFIATTELSDQNNIANWWYANPRAGHCLLYSRNAIEYMAIKYGLRPLLHDHEWHVFQKQ